MDQINQFPQEQGVGSGKFKIISIILGALVLILVATLVVVLLKKPVATTSNQPLPLTTKIETEKPDNTVLGTNVVAPVVKKDASVEDKKMMGVPDVSNIEITSRDNTGRPTSYKILKGANFVDSDNDGLTDADEKKFGTDPKNIDTDGDGVSDWQELGSGTDPKVKNDFTTKK